MGWLDVFGGSKGALKKHAARVANKRAQAPDRWDSLRALADAKTPEAAAALLERFTFRVDPSITDQEEKELALDGVVAAGEGAIDAVVAFLARAESVSWPVKALERLAGPDRLTTELLVLLEAMGTDYERDPERKIQVVSLLGERRDARVGPAVARFLEDADETVRFQAVSCLFAQGPEAVAAARESLVALLAREDSVRVRARALEGIAELGLALTPDEVERVRERLPASWALDPGGRPRKR